MKRLIDHGGTVQTVGVPVHLPHVLPLHDKRALRRHIQPCEQREERALSAAVISGGEQQRVAIARAIAAGGEILLADEPTGNLDSQNEKVIVDLLCKLAHEDNYAVIVVTHNEAVAAAADVVYGMTDGMLSVVREA